MAATLRTTQQAIGVTGFRLPPKIVAYTLRTAVRAAIKRNWTGPGHVVGSGGDLCCLLQCNAVHSGQVSVQAIIAVQAADWPPHW